MKLFQVVTYSCYSLLETRKKLIMKTEPLKKYDGYLSYKIEASVMKLPVIA